MPENIYLALTEFGEVKWDIRFCAVKKIMKCAMRMFVLYSLHSTKYKKETSSVNLYQLFEFCSEVKLRTNKLTIK